MFINTLVGWVGINGGVFFFFSKGGARENIVSNIKYPIEKSIFAVNFLLKLLPATIANADIGSLKSLNTLFDKYLDHMLVKFEQNYMVQTTRNLWLFDKKTNFLKPFLTKR